MDITDSQALYSLSRWRPKGLLAAVFLSASAVRASTCIVSGWPVAENVNSSSFASTSSIVLGGASAFEGLGDVDLGRMTRDISEGIGIDARDFKPGLILVIR